MCKNFIIVMILMLMVWLWADGTPAEGLGTENEPYLIETLDNLLWLSTTDNVWVDDIYFLQTADIDASDTENWNGGAGFSPIGGQNLNSFRGSYNGGNHFIDALYINRPNESQIGLFGDINAAWLEALRVTNINVTGSSNVGGLVGVSFYSTISTSYATGSVTGEIWAGGLVGHTGNTTIRGCYAACIVAGDVNAGGLVGAVYNLSSIRECYATGIVNGGNNVGGLLGLNYNGSSVSDSYASCSVTGIECVGGLVGINRNDSSISTCYATGSVTGDELTGGFVGHNWEAEIDNSIWNIETSGQTIGVGYNEAGTIADLQDKTTAEMQIMGTYTDIGWDFMGESVNGIDDFWDIEILVNNGYPYICDLEWSYYEDGLFVQFEAEPTFGFVPLTVNFTDESVSQASIITWQWDFENDGNIDSYEQNPVWVYNDAGIYSVSLTVSDAGTRETSTEVREYYITVDEASLQPQGNGIEIDPYLVETLSNLLWISTNESCWSSYFLQIEDIDAGNACNWNDGAGFSPIGDEDLPFSGNYNGDNHVIDGLYINRPEAVNIGLFGYQEWSDITLLGLTNVFVVGYEDVGSLVGHIEDSSISGCFAEGNVDGYQNIGGLVGYSVRSTISSCYTTVDVNASFTSGGMAAVLHDESAISNCYFTGNVSAYDYVGGIVGIANNYCAISNCYSTGSVSGTLNPGGLVGRNSYSTINNSIWNIELSGQELAIGFDISGTVTNVLSASALEMQTISTYTNIGWDFAGETVNGTEDLWDIQGFLNNGYPFITELFESIYTGELQAYFTAIPVSGYTPLSVNFTDGSFCENMITTWQWDFEDDGVIDSYEQHPQWIYDEPGVYSVCLTISDDVIRETSSFTRESYVVVTDNNLLPEGSGTENDPYLIATLDNLLWLSTTGSVWGDDIYFLQTADIDASDTQNWNDGAGFSPIGNDYTNQFQGTYNGGDHVIDGLCIDRPGSARMGFIEYTSGAVIDSLGIINISVTGSDLVGGLVGANRNSTLRGCYTSGNVNGYFVAGGLVGSNFENSTLWECYSSVNVTGTINTGGLVGSNSDSMLSECYASGNVTGTEEVGGLVGVNYGDCTISGSYATGNVTGTDNVGGLVGVNSSASTISSSYASGSVTGNHFVGGLVGQNHKSMINESYYDYETVLINNQHLISIGALTSDLYNAWINNNMTLDISEYLSYDGENYLINNRDDFEKLLFFGQDSEYHFLLTADIDLTGNLNFFIPYFAGNFDGDNHIIDGLNVNCPEIGYIGLFAYTFGASIEALGITNINVTGNKYVGGLAGLNDESTVSECFAAGSITGINIVGGLVGYNLESTLSKSYATGIVSGNSQIGGLMGRNYESTLSESYASSIVSGYFVVGGLAGSNYGSMLSESYAIGSVSGVHYAGGLVGSNYGSTLSDAYSTGSVIGEDRVGGLVGSNTNTLIENCIWNIESSNHTNGVGYNDDGTITNLLGKTTVEMQMMSTFTDIGWDFVGESVNGDEDIWDMIDEINGGYPYIYDLGFPVGNDEAVIENVKCKIENYPNPFNPETTISFFTTEGTENTELNIYNMKGQKVKTLVNEILLAGQHSVIWNGTDNSNNSCASGIYFYMIRVDENVMTGKMMMVK